MTWLQIALLVVGNILKYGPTLWRLGKEAYEIVDAIVGAFKRSKPDAKPAEIKAVADLKFDQTLVRLAEARRIPVPAPVTRTQLRRDVWATRPENIAKVRSGKDGRKPT